jgi:uncharacterized membrane protein YdfJ with MMPL/SSD domain
VVVPVKAIVMNVLSLGATFGALSVGVPGRPPGGLLGFDPPGSLDLLMPVIVFVFAFGLSMDYEVFLLSRIREVWEARRQRTGPWPRASALGADHHVGRLADRDRVRRLSRRRDRGAQAAGPGPWPSR